TKTLAVALLNGCCATHWRHLLRIHFEKAEQVGVAPPLYFGVYLETNFAMSTHHIDPDDAHLTPLSVSRGLDLLVNVVAAAVAGKQLDRIDRAAPVEETSERIGTVVEVIQRLIHVHDVRVGLVPG